MHGEHTEVIADLGIDEEDEHALERVFLSRPTQMYRTTTLGKTLMDALEDLQQSSKIPEELASKVLNQFDRSILNALSQRLTARVTFKSAKLSTYRFLDGAWTFILKHTEFREFNCFANVDCMKIVAFEGKVPDPRAAGGKRRWKRYGIAGQNCNQGGNENVKAIVPRHRNP